MAQGNLAKRQLQRFFQLKADAGVLIKFESKEAFEKIRAAKTDVLQLQKKQKDKLKIEIMQLKKVLNINHSFRDEFTKQNQHCLELYYANDQILYLACFDNDQIKQWLSFIKKAMVFHEWYSALQEFLDQERPKLTEQVAFSLNEIIEFAEQYTSIEVV
mmetsp:Transcript_3679/g.5535  ORF Transcript_3679/g.5535 Transcript_3679/m.5535 type:complete len:159 (+) Transcript_3679:1224-1700(+)